MRATLKRPLTARAMYASFAVCCGLALGACGGDEGGSADSGAGADEETVKVGLALVGPRNDKSFSQGAYEGAQQAERESDGRIEVTSVVENVAEPQEAVETLRNLANAGNDVVYGGASSFVNAAQTVAPSFPDVHFLVASPTTDKGYPNVTTIVVQPGLPSFIAGTVMAKLSESGTVGWIGGGEGPTTLQSRAGVKAGVEHVDPKIEFLDTITGDYNDPAKAKSAAEAQTAEGADQVMGYLDAAIQGVYEATRGGDKTGVYQIVNLDCSVPGVVGSSVFNVKQFSTDALIAFSEGTLEPGTIFYTLETPEILRFELCPKFADLEPHVEDITQKIIDGEIEVPEEALFPRPEYEIDVR